MSCDCFTCSNKEDLRSCKAYLLGQLDAYRDCFSMLKSCGVTSGSLSEDGFSNMFASVKCNMEDAACILDSEEFHNIKFEGHLAKEFEHGNEESHNS